MSPYFACAYFDQTYFDTDCAPAGGRGGHGIRVIRRRPEPPQVLENEDDLLMVRLL